MTPPEAFDAESAVKNAILDGFNAGGESPTVEDQVDAIFRAVLAMPVRPALLSLCFDGLVEFVEVEGELEPRGFCEQCRRLVGVTNRQGIGLADRAAYMDSRAKGMGCFLVPHDQQGSSMRCSGSGKRIHA